MEPTLISIETQNDLMKQVIKNAENHQFCITLLGKHFNNREDLLYSEKQNELTVKHRELSGLIMNLWDMFKSTQNDTNPFTMLHNGKAMNIIYSEISKHKEHPDFYTIILMTLYVALNFRGDIPITSEYLRVLDVKYLP